MLRLVQNMDPERFEHVILCPPDDEGILGELRQCPNCRVVGMEFRALRNAAGFWKLLRLTKQGDFDLIHSHGKAAGIYGRIVSRLTGIPITHHFHGIHYKQYYRPVQFLYWKLEALLSKWSKRIICVSSSERKEGISLGMFTDDQSVVIHNGVDTDKFKHYKDLKSKLRKEWNIPSNANVIVSITRLCYQKNPELSLIIHAEICRKYPDTYLLLIGIPPEYYKIVKLAEKLKIKDRVIFTDKQSEMNLLLNIGDLYLSTSRWEGLSLGIIEAMATELPVVLSEVVGNAEFLNGQGDGAFFVREDSTTDYIATIENLLKNREQSRESGKVARNKIIKQFNLYDSVKMLENEYLQIIQ